jgi:hypothetical protein
MLYYHALYYTFVIIYVNCSKKYFFVKKKTDTILELFSHSNYALVYILNNRIIQPCFNFKLSQTIFLY